MFTSSEILDLVGSDHMEDLSMRLSPEQCLDELLKIVQHSYSNPLPGTDRTPVELAIAGKVVQDTLKWLEDHPEYPLLKGEDLWNLSWMEQALLLERLAEAIEAGARRNHPSPLRNINKSLNLLVDILGWLQSHTTR